MILSCVQISATMTVWGSAFRSYIPSDQKVFGCICISDTNKVLLVKGRRGEKKWSFPKGHRDAHDTSPLDCALRELREETGLTVKGAHIASKRYKAAEYYIFALPEEYEPSPQDHTEVEEARWVSIHELPLLHKNIDVSLFYSYLEERNVLAEIP